MVKLEGIEVENEKKELLNRINECNAILTDPDKMIAALREKLIDMKNKFGDARRTEITQVTLAKEEKEVEFVKAEDVVVVISESGNVKRIPSSSFKTQKKNGKGIKNQDDVTMDIISTNTVDTLMIFTNKGKMYRLLVDSIPTGTNASRGTSIKTLVSLDANEEVAAITSLYRETSAKYVVFVTKNGTIKKSSIEEYSKTKKSTGIVALGLRKAMK